MLAGMPATIGPYRIVRLLGAGGMGAVYEAVHESIERRVALKVLHPNLANDPSAAMRFFNEARAVNIVDHPAIVQVSDYGRLADGTAYLVMELLHGETLSQRLVRCKPGLPLVDTLRVARQLAAALTAAHAKGIVHRDLKPDNLMLIPDPDLDHPGRERLKILDFGIAKVLMAGTPGGAATRHGLLIGTPQYMSPEQCRGAASVDEKTDVYSLGIILYQLLTQTTPFDQEEVGSILAAHIYEPVPPLRNAAPAVPAELAELVHRLLAKDKTQRPTMKQVGEELEVLTRPYRSAGSGDAPSVPAPPVPAPPPELVAGSAPTGLRAPTVQAQDSELYLGAAADGHAEPDPGPDVYTDANPSRIRGRSLLLLTAAGLFLPLLGGYRYFATRRSDAKAGQAAPLNQGNLREVPRNSEAFRSQTVAPASGVSPLPQQLPAPWMPEQTVKRAIVPDGKITSPPTPQPNPQPAFLSALKIARAYQEKKRWADAMTEYDRLLSRSVALKLDAEQKSSLMQAMADLEPKLGRVILRKQVKQKCQQSTLWTEPGTFSVKLGDTLKELTVHAHETLHVGSCP